MTFVTSYKSDFDRYIHFNQPEKFDAEGLGESWNAQLPIQQNCVW